jgi:hypothetical protein
MNRSLLRAASALTALLLAAHCASATRVETVKVPSNEEWSAATTHPLAPGTACTREVEPAGQWTSGSWTGGADGDVPQWGDYPLPGAKACSLIGRLGPDGEPFFIGTRYEGVADRGGVLEFAMNDVPGTRWDNRGELTVVVTAH